MATEWPRALRILALKEALSPEPSHDFFLRKVFRWYSKTFSTPLHQVYDLPLFDIMQAWYEELYINLAEEKESPDFHEELSNLSKTEDELEKEKLSKAKNEVEDWLFEKATVADNKKTAEQAAKEKKKIAEAKIQRDREVAKQIEALLAKDTFGVTGANVAAPKEAKPAPEPPEINMSFTGLEDIGELDGLTAFT